MQDNTVTRLISGAYRAVGDLDRWPEVIDDMRRALGADAAVQFSSNAVPHAIKRTTVSRSTIIGIDETSAELHARHAPASPIAPIVTLLATGSIHAVYDLVPQDQFERSFFHDRCVRPTGMTDALFGALTAAGPNMATLNFMKAGAPFRPLAGADGRAANEVMMHLARAFRLNLRLATIGLDPGGTLAATLDIVSVALIVVGGAGECVWANARGERLLACADGLGLDRGRLLAGTTGRNAVALRRMVDDLGKGMASSCGLDRPSGLAALLVVATPLARSRAGDARDVLGTRSAPLGVLALHEPEPADQRAAASMLGQRLQELFHLTAAEARVAVAIHRTPGLRAVADGLGIARTTVQTHLRRVFEKLDVATQSGLCRRLEALTLTCDAHATPSVSSRSEAAGGMLTSGMVRDGSQPGHHADQG